jgi:glycerol-3-phosphate dehydrogenase (NAD(P)+)
MTRANIGVVGAGAWGTALAQVAAVAGSPGQVLLWMRDAAAADAINQTHANEAKLPGVPLSRSIVATADMAQLSGCQIILIATPAQTVRGVLQALQPFVGPGTRLVMTAKGFERGTAAFMSDVMAVACPTAEPLILSGPSFAGDVVRGLPTAVTLAARSIAVAQSVAPALSMPTFRLYLSDDLAGAQAGGAVKNVLAIACGIVAGKRLGDSARSALIARAFAELNRLGAALGARPETLGGLSGLGDLVLTCTSTQSRNFRLGEALGAGRGLAEILQSQRGTSEGLFTASVVVDLAKRHGVEMPIVAAVSGILDGRVPIDAAIEQLLQRPIKTEY